MKKTVKFLIILILYLVELTTGSFADASAQTCSGGVLIAEDSSRCENEPTLLTLTGSNGTHTWLYRIAGSTDWDVLSPEQNTFMYVLPETEREYTVLSTGSGGCSEYSSIVTLRVSSFVQMPNPGAYSDACGNNIALYAYSPTGGLTGYWSAVSGPGEIVFYPDAYRINPDSAIASEYGTYQIAWNITDGICTKDTIIEVDVLEIPVANAGPNFDACGRTFNMNAIQSVAGSTGEWVKVSPPSGVFNFINNTNPQTEVNANPGTYQIRWIERNGFCQDDTIIQVRVADQPKADAGAGSSVCGLGSFVSAIPSIGLGNWQLLSAPGSITYGGNNSNLPENNLVASDYGENYILQWKEINGFCSDSDTIVINFYEQPVVTAIDPDDACGLTTLLTAYTSTASNSVIRNWSQTNGPGGIETIEPLNDSVARVSLKPGFYGSYSFQYTETNGICSDSTEVALTFFEQPAANAGSDMDTCGLGAQMNAITSVAGSTTLWAVDGDGTAVTFSDSTSENSAVSSLEPSVYRFVWAETNGVCSSSDTVVVEFIQVPRANAGLPDRICGKQYMLNAVRDIAGSSLSWKNLGTPGEIVFSDSTLPNSGITAASYHAYPLELTETYRSCYSSDTITIQFIETPLANAGIDIETCGLELNLSASRSIAGSSIQWLAPTASGLGFTNPSSVNTDVNSETYDAFNIFLVETNVFCSDTDTVVVDFIEIPAPSAGVSDSICGLNYSLNANGSIEGSFLSWLSPAGITISENTDPKAEAVAEVYGLYRVVLEETNRICSSSDTIEILFIKVPIANAGQPDSICGLEYTLQAKKEFPGSNGTWYEIASPNDIPITANETALAKVGSPGIHYFKWTETNIVCSASDTVSIDFIEIPIANAGLPDSACGFEYTLNASRSVENSTGQWALVSETGTTVISTNFSTPAIVGAAGVYNYQWTEINRICPDTSYTSITYFVQPKAEIINANDACAREQTIEVSPLTGNYGRWLYQSNSGEAVFEQVSGDENKYNILVSDTGKYLVNWQVYNAACSDDTIFTIAFFVPPLISARSNDLVCGKFDTLNAISNIGNGLWKQLPGTGTSVIRRINDSLSIVQVSEAGNYSFVWEVVNGACVSDTTLRVSFLEIPNAHAGYDSNICGQVTKLNATPDTGYWTVVSGPGELKFSPGTNSPSPVVHCPEYGTYALRWTAVNQICSDTSSVKLLFIPKPVANAGENIELNNKFETDIAAMQPLEGDYGEWKLLSGSGDILNQGAAETFVRSLSLGENVFEWTVYNSLFEMCQSSDELSIMVYDIFIPEVITPNGDNVNDIFEITGIEDIENVEVTVFNRWGIEVFYSANYQNNWDGTGKNNQELTNDTYFYVINIAGAGVKKGFVVIKR